MPATVHRTVADGMTIACSILLRCPANVLGDKHRRPSPTAATRSAPQTEPRPETFRIIHQLKRKSNQKMEEL